MEANAISLISQWVTLLRLSPAFPIRKTKLGGASFPAGVRKGEIQQAGQMRGGGSQADKVNLLTFSISPEKWHWVRIMETLRAIDTRSLTQDCPALLYPCYHHRHEIIAPNRNPAGGLEEGVSGNPPKIHLEGHHETPTHPRGTLGLCPRIQGKCSKGSDG